MVEESKSEETSMASDSAYIQLVTLVERVDIEGRTLRERDASTNTKLLLRLDVSVSHEPADISAGEPGPRSLC